MRSSVKPCQMASKSSIPPVLEPEILAKFGEGWSSTRIAEWLRTEKAIQTSYRSVARVLERTQKERGDVARGVVREQLQKTLVTDLEVMDALRLDLETRAKGLLDPEGKLPRESHYLYLKTRELELKVLDRKLHYAGADEKEDEGEKLVEVMRVPQRLSLDDWAKRAAVSRPEEA